MKTLKNIAFFMTAAAAVVLSACNGGINNVDNQTTKVPFEIHYDGKVITNDTTINTSTQNSEGTEVVFECDIVNTSEKDHDYVVTEERQFDLTKYGSQACIGDPLTTGQCIPSNEEKTQEYPEFTLVPGEEQLFSGHFLLPKDNAEAGTYTSVYSFTDGTKVVKVTVNYVYEK